MGRARVAAKTSPPSPSPSLWNSTHQWLTELRAGDIDFFLMVASFGTGYAPAQKPTVENTTRIAPPSHRGLAREEVRVVVDGVPQTLEVVRQERIHGQEGYWSCPRCGELRWHLYVHNSEVACRVCLGLSYACRHHNAAAIRARKLRRKLGGSGKLLTALPPRPRWPHFEPYPLLNPNHRRHSTA